MTLDSVIHIFGRLRSMKFTGRIILDFHKGNISNKIKKVITEAVEKTVIEIVEK